MPVLLSIFVIGLPNNIKAVKSIPVLLGHSFYFFRLTGDFEKKWSRGDEIKIKIKPKNVYSRYTKYKKK